MPAQFTIGSVNSDSHRHLNIFSKNILTTPLPFSHNNNDIMATVRQPGLPHPPTAPPLLPSCEPAVYNPASVPLSIRSHLKVNHTRISIRQWSFSKEHTITSSWFHQLFACETTNSDFWCLFSSNGMATSSVGFLQCILISPPLHRKKA